ncbi:hypothetical protein HNQ71_003486 [Mesorhizobium sangaii]|uniref:Uncharacterized protein n=1 Tax=Mesorhizobium sangaii TaxID=505389 RepID=A0A841PKW3_9HYPH|nr:hypothetical protein [Mesorhizobium sangaii]
MDTVTSAIMVLLSCSPDLMLCRAAAARPMIFSTTSQCEEALADQISRVPHAGQKTVGRCQVIRDENDITRWGVSPNGELFYASATDVIGIVASTATPAPAKSRPATVRVTRGNGSGAVTTSSYTVLSTGSK